MKQFMLIITLFITNIVLSTNATAASAEVTMKDYKSFYDVNEGSYTRAGFKDLLTEHLTEHFTEFAAKLPENQVLTIEITDIDLAGHVRVGAMNSTRIVKNIYPPRINFTYQLVDGTGKTIKSEDVVLRNLGFMSNYPLKYRNKSFGYEKKMLDDWFEKVFDELIIKE